MFVTWVVCLPFHQTFIARVHRFRQRRLWRLPCCVGASVKMEATALDRVAYDLAELQGFLVDLLMTRWEYRQLEFKWTGTDGFVCHGDTWDLGYFRMTRLVPACAGSTLMTLLLPINCKGILMYSDQPLRWQTRRRKRRPPTIKDQLGSVSRFSLIEVITAKWGFHQYVWSWTSIKPIYLSNKTSWCLSRGRDHCYEHRDVPENQDGPPTIFGWYNNYTVY